MSDLRDAVIREIQNLPTSYRVQTLLEEAVRSAYAGDEIEAWDLINKAIRDVSLERIHNDRHRANRVLEFIDEIRLGEIYRDGNEDRAIEQSLETDALRPGEEE